MRGGFVVNRDLVRAGFDEQRRVFVGVRNHQVNVQYALRDFADRFHNRRADRQVRDEVAIHDVDVQHGCASALHARDFFAKAREVGRKDGGKDVGHRHP